MSKMRILFLASNPSATGRLDLEEELRSIETELARVKHRTRIEFSARHAVRPDDLVRYVREEQPTVIHFSGHGTRKGIVLRSDTEGFMEVPGTTLRRFLQERGVQLLVLNACYSHDQVRDIGPAVRAVVGTTDAVYDEAARRFTVAFYRGLGNGLTIGESFRDGGDAVALHDLPDVFLSSGDLDFSLISGGQTKPKVRRHASRAVQSAARIEDPAQRRAQSGDYHFGRNGLVQDDGEAFKSKTPLAQAGNSRVRSGVLVSYSRKDGEPFARALMEQLQSRGIFVWQDRAQMEGGRDWWEQIKDALKHVEYMVLVMTPAAMQSDVVRREWRHARQQGVCVYPVIASADIDIGSLPRWMNNVHWYDLEHQEAKFFNDLNTRCRLRRVPFMAEPLPADFVPRGCEFEQLKSLLLSSDKQEPIAKTAAFQGAGGYGKTALARAICADDDVQNAFDDGILWVTLGEAISPSTLLGKLNDLIETLSDERPAFEGLDAASTRLRELLADRDILMVIDDVWRAADLRPFLAGGTRCTRLITTRRADTLPPDACKVQVEQMRGTEAAELLSKGLPSGYEEALGALAARLGEWPLLLKLGNSWLLKRIRQSQQPIDQALGTLNQALTKRGITAFDPQNALERNDAAAKTLELSFAGLDASDQCRLLELAVFEEDLNIPMSVLERFWARTGGLDELEVEEACQRLFDDSLLVEYRLDERFIRLHDSIRAWLMGRASDISLRDRHGQLLASYERPQQPWHKVPDDGYVHAHLAWHLAGAGRQADLEMLLLDLDWIQTRLLARRDAGKFNTQADVFGLLSAYDLLTPTPDLTLVRHALQMSTHVIAARPEQVGLQLYGRLGTNESSSIQALCRQAIERAGCERLLPLLPSLSSPGPLVLTLAHASEVSGAAVLAKGRRALSWSNDLLKLWDLERGELLHTLAGHESWVLGAILLAAERQALSWSRDRTLKLWDLARGELLHSLVGHDNHVMGATLLADGRQALSWSTDRTLKLWDLQQGELLHTLAGQGAHVNGATSLAEGKRALSWGDGGTLKLWDLVRGGLLHNLPGHQGTVMGVTLLAKESRALSWSSDGTLKLWDLARGELLGNLGGHEELVRGAILLAAERQALSWSDDGTLKLWDLEQCELLRNFAGHEEKVKGATLLAAERQALSWSDDGTLKLWDLERGDLLGSLASGEIWIKGAAVLAEERQVLSWSGFTLNLWDLKRGKLLRRLTGHEAPVRGATVLAEGQQALSWSGDCTLRLWDLRRGELPGNDLVGHESAVKGSVADGRKALSWSFDRTIMAWDLERGELLHRLLGHESLVEGAMMLAGGRRVLSWSTDKYAWMETPRPIPSLKLWDLERGELMHNLEGQGNVRGVVVLEEGRQAVCWSDDRRFNLWDLERGELIHNLKGHEGNVKGVMLLAEGRKALSWSEDETLRLWDLEQGGVLHTLAGQGAHINGVMPLAAGKRALSWGNDGSLKLWDLAHGELLHDLAGHLDSVSGVALLAEERRALSWSGDGTLKLWDLARGELLDTLVGHEEGVKGVTLLSASDRQALSWSDDGTLKLWDLERCQLLRSLAGHESPVEDALLLTDGRRALSWSSNDSTLKIWDLDNGKLLHNLEGHEGKVSGITLLAQGRQALSWSNDHSVRLWDLARGRCLSLYISDASLRSASIGYDESRVFLGDSLGRIHLLRLNTAEERESEHRTLLI